MFILWQFDLWKMRMEDLNVRKKDSLQVKPLSCLSEITECLFTLIYEGFATLAFVPEVVFGCSRQN